jgi:hypothetical protein
MFEEMNILDLLPPLQGLDRIIVSSTPGSPEPSVLDHLGLYPVTPPAFKFPGNSREWRVRF